MYVFSLQNTRYYINLKITINRVKIMKNEIRENTLGIEINSADPYILNNIIEKNYGNGILTNVFDNLRCDGKIRNNDILGNLENGIDA